MTIVPYSHPTNQTSVPPFEGHRWPCRVYPGDLSELARMRRDLRRDLDELPDLSADTAENIVLCGSELFANAVDHSRSGEPEGHLIRTLTIPEAGLLRLGVIDDGHRTANPGTPAGPSDVPGPVVPADRSVEEWAEAERGRSLLLVEHLSLRWGSRAVVGFPFCEGQGTFLWAEFSFTPATSSSSTPNPPAGVM